MLEIRYILFGTFPVRNYEAHSSSEAMFSAFRIANLEVRRILHCYERHARDIDRSAVCSLILPKWTGKSTVHTFPRVKWKHRFARFQRTNFGNCWAGQAIQLSLIREHLTFSGSRWTSNAPATCTQNNSKRQEMVYCWTRCQINYTNWVAKGVWIWRAATARHTVPWCRDYRERWHCAKTNLSRTFSGSF